MGAMLVVALVAFPELALLHLSPAGIALLVAVALIDGAGNYFLFRTYHQAHPAATVPLLSLAPAFAFPIAGLAGLSQQPSVEAVVFGYVATALVVLVSMDWKNFGEFHRTTLAPAILSSLCFGLSAVPTRFLLREWHEINAPTLYTIRAFLIAGLCLALWRGRAVPKLPWSQMRMIGLRAVFVIAQYLLLYQALTVSSVGVAMTLANLTPALVVVGGALFLGEAWSWKRIVPAVLAIVAALLMG